MKHRFRKAMFRYLLEIVSEGDGDATGRIIQDLSRQTRNANVQFQLCETAVRKIEGKSFVAHKDVEKIIEFVCDSAKRIGVYDKGTATRILSLIMTDSIIKRAYAEIAEAMVFILDDRGMSENILKRAFEIFKSDMQNRTKHILISENAIEGISKDEHYTCSTLEFVRLAYCWIGVGRDIEYAKEIVGYGSPYAVGFTEYLELAEFYINYPEERYTAFKFFRRAEEQANDFDDYCCLCHDLYLLVQNDVWAMQIFDKCRTMAKTADDFTRLGEIIGNKNGLPNMDLCREMFAMAMERAMTDEEKSCVQDSWENVMEEHEIY
ncbi:MAG TPA: hypothetical protein DET40_25125 [Lentisphaeria bacterium]|nr:MAG: hypothetical protein A2X45_18835 [Lentisphaerae bacterium GWF2_50_93]HCE46843.1 hypothetical protein [Lentisphaeria bacterium]